MLHPPLWDPEVEAHNLMQFSVILKAYFLGGVFLIRRVYSPQKGIQSELKFLWCEKLTDGGRQIQTAMLTNNFFS